MRVLTLIDSLAVGGAERSLAALAPPLVARGLEMHVAFLLDRPGVESDLRNAGVTLHSLAGTGGRLGSLRRAVRLIGQIEPTLVHTTLFEADLAGRTAGWLRRVPVVSSVVSEPYGPEHIHNPEYRPWKVQGAHVADATTARFVTRFHSVSSNAADVMAKRLRIDRGKIDVIPRGRDPEQLGERSDRRRRAARSSIGVTETEQLVLAVGRQFHVKGFDVLIEAFATVAEQIPDARLVVVGREGPATSDLKRLIAARGLDGSVTLPGFRSDVPDLICAADIFAFPSRSEGSPGVLLEAMALRAPIVASDIPSVLEVAGSGEPTMVTTALGSPREMAGAIVQLLQDHKRANEIVGAAHARFLDSYTIESVAEATMEFYRRTVSDR